MKFFIKTFGCQQNVADSERVASAFKSRGIDEGTSYDDSNFIIINTCMIRESAENRVFGLIENLAKIKEEKLKKKEVYKLIVTGCMVGIAFRDKTGKYMERLRRIMPEVDEFMPIEEVGFNHVPIRIDKVNAWVPISNGCNNFCTFCVVPFTRGREISRPYEDIVNECQNLKKQGFKNVTLLGQNVNSYGADLIVGEKNIQVLRDIEKTYFAHPSGEEQSLMKTYTVNGRRIKPIYVKHLGRQRIPTLFPYLLEDIAKMGFEKVDFISSNPWDFSDELIDVIAKYKNITRQIHLPVQAGDNTVLRRMNRWYTTEEYIDIIEKLRAKVPDIKFTTDIIVGFCGETEEEFNNTVKFVKKVRYEKAYIARYSIRPMTAATKVFHDTVPAAVKKQRWEVLETIINKPHLLHKHHVS